MIGILVLPIISQQRPGGGVRFRQPDAGAFDAQEIGMCSMLVDQMSYSLENIRLVGELSRSRDAVIRGMALLAEIRDTHIGGHLNRICEYSPDCWPSRLVGRPGYHEVTPRIHPDHRPGGRPARRGQGRHSRLDPAETRQADRGRIRGHEDPHPDRRRTAGRPDRKTSAITSMITMGADVAQVTTSGGTARGIRRGQKGREIPLAARILAICDVYDALTSERVYKEAWTHEDTEETIRDRRVKQFDPELVEIFFENPEDLFAVRARYPD